MLHLENSSAKSRWPLASQPEVLFIWKAFTGQNSHWENNFSVFFPGLWCSWSVHLNSKCNSAHMELAGITAANKFAPCLRKLTTAGMEKYTKNMQLMGLCKRMWVGWLLHGSNVNRTCFYSNSSLGGSWSRLILSMIKAHTGEGMRRTERANWQTWIKVGRWREQAKERRNGDKEMGV